MEAAAGAGPPAPVEVFDLAHWGWHLKTDFDHDKLYPSPPYNISPLPANFRDLSEVGFFDYALNTFAASNAEFGARRLRMIELGFDMATPTGTFRQTAPSLIPSGNQTLAVVTDNGEFITRDYLDAIHFVSFGNAIDPAPTTVDPRSRPVYYKPDGNANIYIDLQQFGFTPSVINGVWIADVDSGRQIKTAWVRPADRGRLALFDPGVDADNTRGILDVCGSIPDSNLKIERNTTPELRAKTMNILSGMYSSVAGAVTGAQKQNKKIGKTLGDTMIVASAMPKFIRYDKPDRPSVDNPLYGANREGWKQYGREDRFDSIPVAIAVKTGDRLNAVRAIFKNVPTIFEQLATGTSPRHFEFYPSEINAEEVAAQLPRLYDRLIQDVSESYNRLVLEFQEAIDAPTGRVKDAYVKIQPPDSRADTFFSVRKNPDPAVREGKLQAAATYIRETIIPTLNDIKEETVRHFQDRKASANIVNYKEDVKDLVKRCPQTNEVLRYKELGAELVRYILPVQLIPRSKEIHMYALYSAIEEGYGTGTIDAHSNMAVFRERLGIPAPVGPMEGGDRSRYINLLKTYVEHLTPPEAAGGAPLPKVSINEYRDVSNEDYSPFILPASYMALTWGFIEYDNPREPLASLNRLHRLYSHASSSYIMDNSMLYLFRSEFTRLSDASAIVIQEGRVPEPTRDDILRFNKFTCHVNYKNATMGETDNDTGFDVLRREFNRILIPGERAPAPAPGPFGMSVDTSAAVRPASPGPAAAGAGGEAYTPARGSIATLSPGQQFSPPSAAHSSVEASPDNRYKRRRIVRQVTKALIERGRTTGSELAGPRRAGRRRTYRLKKKPTK
jgi:hypothetical protein